MPVKIGIGILEADLQGSGGRESARNGSSEPGPGFAKPL